jgi:hypothetical protein
MTYNEYDKVISLLGLFSDYPTWTKDKRTILNLVYQYIHSGTHEYFTSNCCTQWISNVGDHYTEKPEHMRRGTLKKYRGKKVFVMCVCHGSYNVRRYVVATVE